MAKIILAIDGMTCSACSNGLEKYLNKQKGIDKVVVNLVMANAVIEYDKNILNMTDIENFIEEAGFKSLGEFKEIKLESKNKRRKIIFGIMSFLAILIMYISMGHMLKLPVIKFLNPHKYPLNYGLSLLLLSICFLIYGKDILKNGYKNLIHKTPNMDTLVGLGVLVSFSYSLFNLFLVIKGNHEALNNLYFESVAIIIYFIKLGRFIDGISKDKTKEAIKKLVEITPKKAVIKVNGQLKEVTIDEVKKKDIVVAKAGDMIAVDGIICKGQAHLDESFITGESKPVLKKENDEVIAGSLNYDGYLEYEATNIGKNSMISQIVKLVVEATNTKMPIATIADKVASIFVPTVISIAFLTFLVYLNLGYSFSQSLITLVTILVVACPCSLGLATPLAIIVSEGVCASKGILIKDSKVLEIVAKIKKIVFDKTGTLTYGKLKIAKIYNYSSMSNQKLIELAGCLEEKSTHPISGAFKDYLNNTSSKLIVTDFKNIAGLGLEGKVGEDKILVGNEKLLEKEKITNNHLKDLKKLTKDGCSIVYIIKNKEILGLIGVKDILRKETKDVLKKIKNENIGTAMLTGDKMEVAEIIGDNIGIDEIFAEVIPSTKSNIIKYLQIEYGLVLMCGDGINDSIALTRADVSISFQSGSDIARDSAGVILTNNDLESIPKLIAISKKTIKIIKQNLFWAFFYNILMIPIAMGVFNKFGLSINPMIASLAMVFSSLTVILNTLRLKR